jgi:adenosylcobyric acid synthase
VKGEKYVTAQDPQAFKETQYDKLAAHVRQYVDIERIYQILSSND